MDRIINKDYVSVIKEENEHLNYYEIDIPQDNDLITILDEMQKDDALTVLDMQKRFITAYPTNCNIYKRISEKFPNGYYNYIYPSDYMASYVTEAGYPIVMTEEEYNTDIEEKKKTYRELYSKEYNNHNTSTQPLEDKNDEIESMVETKITKYKKELRYKFYNQSKRYIYAHNYAKTAESIIIDNRCRMISIDQIGWKEFRFKLNEYISTIVNTNFGYGNSSYFICNLTYKGIDILPYSKIVQYRYVGWCDITRYTRQYAENRNSWKYVFEFVLEAANMAKTNPTLFVETFITNEIRIMMEGLREIMHSPQKKYQRLLSQNNDTPIGYYHLVRNCTNSERKEYAVASEEHIITFKMEKITGSLLFLANLTKIKDLISEIANYITEIIQMNVSLLPEIRKHITNVTENIRNIEFDLHNLEEKISAIKAELEKKTDDYKIWNELSDQWKAHIISDNYFETKLKELLSPNFYKTVVDKLCPIKIQKIKKNDLLEHRKKLLEQLESYQEIIEKFA